MPWGEEVVGKDGVGGGWTGTLFFIGCLGTSPLIFLFFPRGLTIDRSGRLFIASVVDCLLIWVCGLDLLEPWWFVKLSWTKAVASDAHMHPLHSPHLTYKTIHIHKLLERKWHSGQDMVGHRPPLLRSQGSKFHFSLAYQYFLITWSVPTPFPSHDFITWSLTYRSYHVIPLWLCTWLILTPTQ